MTGKTSNNSELPTEPFEVRRRRELLADLKLYDDGLASLTDEIRKERTESGGYFIQAELSTNTISLKLRVLLSGLNQLSRWHSEALAEFSRL